MTKLLEEAIRKASQLPPDMQDRIGAAILAEMEPDLAWEATLARTESLEVLDQWAAEALANLQAGRTEPLDPEVM
ncbi:MAG: hypothetical protein HY703_02275 [Gemmatimonadetes bacterium]|nr:hypothetical protein [Gemmatimonadota bacterium]